MHGAIWEYLTAGLLVTIRCAILLVCLPLFLAAAPLAKDNKVTEGENSDILKIYSEENPPFSHAQNGKSQGLYVDLVLELFKRTGIDKTRHDIVVVPWARAYRETRRSAGSMLFSVVRTPEREKLFKWVGPIGEFRSVVLARKDRHLKFSNPSLFKGYVFGVTKNAQSEKILLKMGVNPNHLIYINSTKSAARMLARGRIDAWARDRTVAFWTLENLGYSVADFEVVHAFKVQNRYIGFNLETPDTLIDKLQHSLDAMRRDGTLTDITRQQNAPQL
jgi:polar amino acid transport system substrate-binding protein